MAMIANAGSQPEANEEPAIGCLPGVEGKAVTHLSCQGMTLACSLGSGANRVQPLRSEEHTSELQSLTNLVCRLLLEKKKKNKEHSYMEEIINHLKQYGYF